jgi:hypothetical protein
MTSASDAFCAIRVTSQPTVGIFLTSSTRLGMIWWASIFDIFFLLYLAAVAVVPPKIEALTAYFTQNGLNSDRASFKESYKTSDSIIADIFTDFCCVSLLIAQRHWRKANVTGFASRCAPCQQLAIIIAKAGAAGGYWAVVLRGWGEGGAESTYDVRGDR